MSADAPDNDTPTTRDLSWKRWYHIPALALAALFMLWIRVQPYNNFVSSDRVHFRGNDAYYHFRTTMYSVENWPRVSYMDPWTEFPTGTTVGQFGTLFDLVVATVALIVGAGSPSEHQVAVVAVLTPAVVGALCIIPVFYITRRLTGNRIAALFGAFVFAILPTAIWVTRSTVGFYSHHVAENFLMATTVLTLLVAVSVAQREKPVYEQVLDGDWDGLRPTIKWSAAAGVVYALYIWTWPPGVIIAGIIGTYFLLAMLAEVLRDNTPEHLAFAAAISMGVGAILVVPWIFIAGDLRFATTVASFTQVFVPLVVAVGSVFLAWLARQWDQRGLERWKYAVTVGAIGAAGIVGAAFLLPTAFNTIWGEIQNVLLLGQEAGTLTISEAQPMDTNDLGNEFFDTYGYGFTFLVALIGVFWLAIQSYTRSEDWEQYLLIVVWTVFLTLMAITQVRFHYYLVSVVAILNGYVFWLLYDATDFSKITAQRDIAFVVGTAVAVLGLPILAGFLDIQLSQEQYLTVAGLLFVLAVVVFAIDYAGEADLEFEAVESYHLLVILLIAIVVVIPIASPVAGVTAVDASENIGPGEVEVWEEGNDWLSEHTPQPGNYGEDTNNADELPYYGVYGATDDYDYPEGAYGVMSWWDYGHWITVEGERIPIANPFQSGVRPASEFLLTDDEDRAELLLDALPADGDPHERTNEELREIVENRDEQEAQEQTRYVMIDHQMAGGKFPAITQWGGPDSIEFQEPQTYEAGEQETQLPVATERFRESMISRLYTDDASELEHYRLVHEVDDYAYVGGNAFSDARFGSIRVEALSPAIEDLQAQQPTPDDEDAETEDPLLADEDGSWSEDLAEFEQQMQTRNLFGQLGPGGLFWDGQLHSSVKTFERVAGATLTGTAEANATVSVSLELETNTNRTFTYDQTVETDDTGEFEVTVPYPTDEELTTDDGFTESGIEAVDEYEIEVFEVDEEAGEQIDLFEGTTAVPETAVVSGEQIDVELTEVERDEETTDDDEAGEEDENATEEGGDEDDSGN